MAYVYSNCIYEKQYNVEYPTEEHIIQTQGVCTEIINDLRDQIWYNDEYRQEILLAAEGLIIMAELFAKFAGYQIDRVANTEQWLEKYTSKWLEKNKPSELYRIIDMFRVLENK